MLISIKGGRDENNHCLSDHEIFPLDTTETMKGQLR